MLREPLTCWDPGDRRVRRHSQAGLQSPLNDYSDVSGHTAEAYQLESPKRAALVELARKLKQPRGFQSKKTRPAGVEFFHCCKNAGCDTL
jgi:hypothetical protein